MNLLLYISLLDMEIILCLASSVNELMQICTFKTNMDQPRFILQLNKTSLSAYTIFISKVLILISEIPRKVPLCIGLALQGLRWHLIIF